MDVDEFVRGRYRHRRVCSGCIEDPDLREYIASTDGEPGCSFCERDDAPTCEFLTFMDHVEGCIETEYDLAANCLPWIGREGGWQWERVWDTGDLIVEKLNLGFAREDHEGLVSAMVDYLGQHDWCVADPFGEDPLETLRLRWKQFCDLIKHHTRFFLDRWGPPPSDETLASRRPPTPAMMLSAIGERVERMGLFRTLPADSTVYRARYCEGGRFLSTAEEMGPPPPERGVVANRMSPPGIIMFYGALDAETALLETATGSGQFAVGEFRVLRDLRLLDLTKVPDMPGFFASIPDSQPWDRRDAEFFHELVDDLTRPIDRDDRVHVEYIPTQVVTEYCRMAFHEEQDCEPLDGIVYPSARNSGRPAVVLFADRTAVAGIEAVQPKSADDPWLKLENVEYFEGSETFRFSPRSTPFASLVE